METIFSLAVAVIILLVDLWAIASVWRSTKTSGTKLGWTALILVLPLVGLAVWGIAGPRGIVEPPTSKEHSKG
ncbi:PLDc_N domain-containing protein [Pseudomonas sp. v388]|uniref:PLD nuclease N-terminal domain-containing protein n=1 Tax=Pseudomonas sp. v388 TaxID=2479849 RepID=UPI000F778365|nr:PLD nuclease N-terminal domain-containing protein [Pseudomonas sp. v388]RRV10562.1 PLDc_N domain-containing protein [Pseudomonas sp. v388]